MRKTILTSLFVLSAWWCSAQVALGGLNTPLQLQPEETKLFLRDYVLDREIRELKLPDGLILNLDLAQLKERGFLSDTLRLSGAMPQKMGFIKISFKDSGEMVIPVIAPSAKKVTIEVPSKHFRRKDEVRIIGNFNNWNRSSEVLKKKQRAYKAEYYLEPGRYAYKFYVDGEEMLDPTNPEKVDNGLGSFNNILEVEETGLEPDDFSVSVEEDSSYIVIRHGKQAPQILATWNNQEVKVLRKKSMPPVDLIRIPNEARQSKRSYIRIFSFLGERKGRDQLIPLHYGKVVQSAEQLDRHDWHAARLYFLMVDRFANGDTANDEKVDDPEIQPMANYFGGDLQGVQAVLDQGYFERLGVNSIWLSPISQNPTDAWGFWNKGKVKSKFSGYHGYWPISNTRIDYRFGNAAVLTELIDSVHAKDQNIILDYVANHVHINHPIYQKNKDWATNLYLPDGTKNTEKWDEYRLTTWFDDHLPTLDLRRYEIVDPMVDSALVWLRDYQLDGFRHDATKHIDELYWRTLTYRIRKMRSEPIYQIGETYGSPGLINSYISTGMLDAQFDFNLYDAAVSAFAKSEGLENLKETLEAGLKTYGYHHLMGNITGNQDRARFISYAGKTVSFDEDPKLAGWDREIPKSGPKAYRRLALLHAFNNFVPGIPCTYYGDEIGLPGANDPDNRRMMYFENWDAQEQKLFDQVQHFNQLRAQELPLLFGKTEAYVEGDLFILKREYFGKSAVLVLNLSEKAQEVVLPFEMPIVRRLHGQDQEPNLGGAETLNPQIRALSYHIYLNY